MVIWSCDKCPATFERQAHLEQHKGTKRCLLNQKALNAEVAALERSNVSRNLQRKLQSTLPAFIRYWLGIVKNGHWIWNEFEVQCIVPGLWWECCYCRLGLMNPPPTVRFSKRLNFTTVHWFTNALASCMLPAAGNLIWIVFLLQCVVLMWRAAVCKALPARIQMSLSAWIVVHLHMIHWLNASAIF